MYMTVRSMPRNVVFVAPFPTETTLRFVRAAARLEDVRLLGVVQTPPAGSEARVYDDIVRVTDPLATSDIIEATELLRRRHGEPYRIVGIVEALMVQLAQAREHFRVPGTSPRVAELFRDKAMMKTALAEAGLPVARHQLVKSAADAIEFAGRVGFPMVLKPPAGMGAKATFRVSTIEALHRAVAGMGASESRPILAEEFLRGQEFSYETVTCAGVPRVDSISRYLPSCLEVLENDWIQWCVVLPRDIDGAEFKGARDMGKRAVQVLGLDDGMTHMEWFQRLDGSLAIGEIAQRPPGANITRMTGLAYDVDPYRAWARAVIDGDFDGPWERKYAVGCAFLRGMGRGRVAQLTGLHEAHEAAGKWIVEANLPTIGAPKSDGYEGDGYVIVRDPSTEVVEKLLAKIIQTIRVQYA
jgi:biotin carboxylase